MYAPRIVSRRTCFNAATLTRPQVYLGVISCIMGFPYAFHPLRYIVNSRPLSSPTSAFSVDFSSRFLQVGSLSLQCMFCRFCKYINDLPCVYSLFLLLVFPREFFLLLFFFVFVLVV